MNKFLSVFLNILIFLLVINCSFDNKSGIWKKHNKKIIEQAKTLKKTEKIFKKREFFKEEIQSNTKIILNKEKANNFWKEEGLNKSNNIDHLFYTNNKNLIFKSKQIGKTKYLPTEITNEPLFFDNYLYFNDLAGNIYKYSISQKKIIWK